MDKAQFVTYFGSHLGNPGYFLVTVTKIYNDPGRDFTIESEMLSYPQARHQLLICKVPFLHESLMNDAERTQIYRAWF